MSEPAVLAALISAVALTIGGLLTLWGKRADRVASAQAAWQTSLETRLDKQEADNAALRERVTRLERSNTELAGALRDRDELLDDMVPLALWIRDGRTPPAPVLTWRIREHLRKHRLPTHPTPIVPPGPPGASS